jgi:hypothetical protein
VGFLLLGLLVGIPLLMIVISAIWDRRHRWMTRSQATVMSGGPTLSDTMAAASLEGIVVEAKSRAAHPGPNFGDLGNR